MKRIRILLVDDHAIVRMGIASILGTTPDFEIVGEAENGKVALRLSAELKPDVVLMDLMMPGMDGATATAELKRILPGTKVLILTTFGTADGIARALDLGASGAVMKNIDYTELVDAIRSVASGKRVIDAEIRKQMRESPPVDELTDRQRHILSSMVKGLTDADIARELGISANGIRNHITAIYGKLGAANRAEAVAIALRKHLIKL